MQPTSSPLSTLLLPFTLLLTFTLTSANPLPQPFPCAVPPVIIVTQTPSFALEIDSPTTPLIHNSLVHLQLPGIATIASVGPFRATLIGTTAPPPTGATPASLQLLNKVLYHDGFSQPAHFGTSTPGLETLYFRNATVTTPTGTQGQFSIAYGCNDVGKIVKFLDVAAGGRRFCVKLVTGALAAGDQVWALLVKNTAVYNSAIDGDCVNVRLVVKP